MELELTGKVAIVSGASKGIGKAIAVALAHEGVRVGLMARGAGALEDTLDEIKGNDGTAMIVTADGTDADSVTGAVTQLTDAYSGLDIVVNNLGGAEKLGAFEDLSDEDWFDAYDLNVLSAVRLVRSSLPWLRQSPAARIINISSIVGLQPGVYNPHYSATRAALLNVSKSLANLLAEDGVLVNSIAPGPVDTDAWGRVVEQVAERSGITADEARADMEERESIKIPLGRIGDPTDVAGCAVFLASKQASWITGACFHIDGGKLMGIG
jgi:NAD(P)-dependent dehydrogenase (short-subunit alcohol dehydrogenase family)